MDLTNKTILITGAGSGIGFATAQSLSKKGNKAIIVGRNAIKIEKAAAELGLDFIVCDVTDEQQVLALVSKVNAQYKDLAVLINNAGVASLYRLGESANAYEKSKQEFETNYFAVVRLTELLLPVLKNQSEAAIVNITSNVSFHPLVLLPTYSDTKAALHSHTVALRLTLSRNTNIKLFEVMPSLINTEATKDMGGENGLPPSVVAENIFQGITADTYEIYVGETARQYAEHFENPLSALEKFNDGLY